MRYKVVLQITSETPDSPHPVVVSTKPLLECNTYEEAVDYVREAVDKIDQPKAQPSPAPEGGA